MTYDGLNTESKSFGNSKGLKNGVNIPVMDGTSA